ncbi:carbohydrate ABC transporter permease, partial [Actinomadura adrarensis]
MNRYRASTLLREIVMIAVAAVVAFPLYVLVNLSLRAPGDASSIIAPTTSPTLDNYAGAWRQA